MAQPLESKLQEVESQLTQLDEKRRVLMLRREQLKLEFIRNELSAMGLPSRLPGDTVVWHQAMALAYAEPYEQARWVAHIVLPDVVEGVVSRSNDFRVDTLIPTGSAVEADYFLKFLNPDSTYRYDGFGYDRGHLAPSADFRWSATALSESYLYSNMSPQVDSFNRGIWGDLEDKIREYVYKNPGTRLYVVTGPVLQPGLPRIERGVNKVSIPRHYWKVVLDKERQRGIGFVLPNQAGYQPLETYSVSIDSVERLTGLDFFPNLPGDMASRVEAQRLNADWFSEVASGDVDPVPIYELKRGQINTLMARNNIGSSRPVTVVGKVVSGRTSRAGNVLLNLDKQYPNEIFTVFIRKDDLPNFAYDIIPYLKGKRIAVTGKLSELGGKPVAFIDSGKEIELRAAAGQ
jgi:endonuclease G